tara:strand:- start:1819 stop:2322 length:504 start_codon:yes stop_codon:yes gene_type:complete
MRTFKELEKLISESNVNINRLDTELEEAIKLKESLVMQMTEVIAQTDKDSEEDINSHDLPLGFLKVRPEDTDKDDEKVELGLTVKKQELEIKKLNKNIEELKEEMNAREFKLQKEFVAPTVSDPSPVESVMQPDAAKILEADINAGRGHIPVNFDDDDDPKEEIATA